MLLNVFKEVGLSTGVNLPYGDFLIIVSKPGWVVVLLADEGQIHIVPQCP